MLVSAGITFTLGCPLGPLHATGKLFEKCFVYWIQINVENKGEDGRETIVIDILRYIVMQCSSCNRQSFNYTNINYHIHIELVNMVVFIK